MTPAIDPPLLPVAPAYRRLIRARLGLVLLVVAGVAGVADLLLLRDSAWRGAPTIIIALLALLLIMVVPERRYRRQRYRLTRQMLHSVRGWLFHVDTIVPFVRVQHLDVTRGPLDKMFGTASLVVHTAGTHNSVVTIHGLAPDRAAEIRDLIREHVRSDSA